MKDLREFREEINTNRPVWNFLPYVYNVHILKDKKYNMYMDIWFFNVFFHVSDGIDQFKTIFE